MPKVKVPRKSTSIDMTAMCDVSFLLLTFFMLTSKFRPPELVPIDLPGSRSQTKIEKVMTITLDKDNKVYFGLPDGESRAKLLAQMMALHPEWSLNEAQKKNFEVIESISYPIAMLPQVLNFDADQYKTYTEQEKGIPYDSANCELAVWVMQARIAEPKMKIAVKGDRDAKITVARDVIKVLTERVNVHKFNLITTLAGSSNKVEGAVK